jgi:PAS domain S-box-containing protein
MRALVLEPDRTVRAWLEAGLRSRGHAVAARGMGEDAWALYERQRPRLALLDFAGPSGPELCRRIRIGKGGDRCVVLATGLTDRPADLKSALEAGADDYLPKLADAGVIEGRLVVAERRARQIEERDRAAEQALRDALRHYRRVLETARTRRLAIRMFAEAPSLADGASGLLQALCVGLGWQAGCLYTVDPDGQQLRLAALWHLPGVDVEPLRSVSRAARPRRGDPGLGEVLKRASATWTTDQAAPGFRAGMSLPVPCGAGVIGVIQLLSPEARPLDRLELRNAQEIAAEVGSLLARRQAEEALRESDERYALAVRVVSDGVWEWDVRSARAYYSPRCKSILGSEGAEGPWQEGWLSKVHPEDLPRVLEKIGAHLDGRSASFDDRHRVLGCDGSYRWVHCRGFAIRDENGKARRIGGAVREVDGRAEAGAEPPAGGEFPAPVRVGPEASRALQAFTLAGALLLPLAWPGSVDAQTNFRLRPSLELIAGWDDNLLSSPEPAEEDWMGRAVPGLEATVTGQRTTFGVRYGAEAERYREHPELAATPAMHGGEAWLDFAGQRWTVVTRGAYTETNRPWELNVSTGITAARNEARRTEARQQLGYRVDPRSKALLDYGYVLEELMGDERVAGQRSDTLAARAGFERRLTPRDVLLYSYGVRRYSFRPESLEGALLTHVAMLGWERRLPGRVVLRLEAGPRIGGGSVGPELDASLRHTYERGELGLGYSQTQTTILGESGVAVTDTVSLNFSHRLAARVTLTLAPGWYWTRLEDRDARVLRSDAELGWQAARFLRIAAAHSFTYETGDLGRAEGGEVRHNTLMLRVRLIPPAPEAVRRTTE